ncbi:hypothetical protein P692DRAFT_201675464, partial [Suillus brevipes Sb2]
LLHHPYLDTINVVVDPDLLILCCQICQVALPPSQMPSHIGNAHSAVQVDDDRYCQAVADMKIASTLPPSVVGGRHRTAYQGLMIHDGQFWRVAGDIDVACDHQEVIDRIRKEMTDLIRVEQVPQEKRMITDELILQRLNSPDPVKEGINNTPLHRHQEAAMQKDYVRVTTSLLAMLLRTKANEGDYSIPLPQNLTDAVIELEDAL